MTNVTEGNPGEEKSRWVVSARSFKGRRTGGRKEGRDGGMKGPLRPDGWGPVLFRPPCQMAARQ